MKKIFEKVKKYSKSDNDIKVIMSLAIVISTVIAMWLAYSVTLLIISKSSDMFEENLWTAKKIVAEEIDYKGMLDAEHFQIFDTGVYVIKNDGVVVDKGTFESPEAFIALRLALEHGDHHQTMIETTGNVVGLYILGYIAGIASFFVTLIAMLVISHKLLEVLIAHRNRKAATEPA